MATSQQYRVFLSYARADRPRVAKLAEALQAAGMTVWWDTEIAGGSSFSADIERELAAADVIVVAWSAASVKSSWVLDEAGVGRDRNRLVPVLLDAAMPPLGFRQLQAIDLAKWKGRASDARLAAVVDAINRLAGSDAATPRTETRPPPATRRMLIGGLAATAVLAAGGLSAWQFWGHARDSGKGRIAVLPFANLSGDPAQVFLADGIAEELRNALSQIRGIAVIGRVSSEKFRDADDLSEVAAQLDVDHVLTGSVRRSATTIRIGAQLVDGNSGATSWSQSYDRPAGDVLAVQSSIASNVAMALRARLGAGAIAAGGTTDAAAQELYLKAQALGLGAVTQANLRERLSLIDAAIALDPAYADAYAVRSALLADGASFAPSQPESDALTRAAMAAARRAVSVAPQSGYARVTLAARLLNGLDVRAALKEGDRALALAPGDVRVVTRVGEMLTAVDPDRAVTVTRRGVTIDPFNPFAINGYANALGAARRPADQLAAGQQVRAMTNNQRGKLGVIFALLALGRPDEARPILAQLPQGWQRQMMAVIVAARTGRRAESDTVLAQMRAADPGTLKYQFAEMHAQRGEVAAALAALDAALRIRDPGLVLVAVDPLLDPIRNEPRFKAVQDKVIPPDMFVPPSAR